LSKTYEFTKNIESILYAKNAIDLILKYKKNGGDSMFPSVIDLFNKSNNLSDSRLAWCYGDLGIAYSILYYYRASRDITYKDIALEIIKHCINRDKNTGVNDKCFCHGTSGLFYIYYKLYSIFDIKIFEKAYKYWLNLTLENYRNISSFETCALNIELKKKEYMLDLGLIEGITGIGLSLISYLDTKENDWEDFFML
jgi:lantibiotic modifying enzyme